MSIPDPSVGLQYTNQDGTATPILYALLEAYAAKIRELEERIAALEP